MPDAGSTAPDVSLLGAALAPTLVTSSTSRVVGLAARQKNFRLRFADSREAAFIYAVSAAGVAYSVTRACSRGELTDCSCDNRVRARRPNNWQWGGCSEVSTHEDSFTYLPYVSLLLISLPHRDTTCTSRKCHALPRTYYLDLSMWRCVREISCQDCDGSYVGQTRRRLITRLNEYYIDINKKSKTPPVMSMRKLEHNDEFDSDDVEILNREPSYCKRLTSEMLYIKRQSYGLNKQSDTEHLYQTVIYLYWIYFSTTWIISSLLPLFSNGPWPLCFWQSPTLFITICCLAYTRFLLRKNFLDFGIFHIFN